MYVKCPWQNAWRKWWPKLPATRGKRVLISAISVAVFAKQLQNNSFLYNNLYNNDFCFEYHLLFALLVAIASMTSPRPCGGLLPRLLELRYLGFAGRSSICVQTTRQHAKYPWWERLVSWGFPLRHWRQRRDIFWNLPASPVAEIPESYTFTVDLKVNLLSNEGTNGRQMRARTIRRYMAETPDMPA